MPVPNSKWQPGTGPQVILKSDFVDIEQAILTQPGVRMQPQVVWVDVATVRVEATADCVAAMQFTGRPNILNPATQASGGLSDGKIRTVTANVSLLVAAGGIYGSEMASQWYSVLGIAGNANTDFTLKGMPYLRVKSQTGQAIKTGTLITPASGRDYGFTENEFVGGIVYFLTGASKGLMRAISANDLDTDTRITYSGDALTVAAGDWFIILPPTNFRHIGYFFNNASSNIDSFVHDGDRVSWLTVQELTVPTGTAVIEDIRCAPPEATAVGVRGIYLELAHPDGNNYMIIGTAGASEFGELPIKNCRYAGAYMGAAGTMKRIYFKHPPGCGY